MEQKIDNSSSATLEPAALGRFLTIKLIELSCSCMQIIFKKLFLTLK